MSEDELLQLIHKTLTDWVNGEMDENEGSPVTREQRCAEHAETFMHNLIDYLVTNPIK